MAVTSHRTQGQTWIRLSTDRYSAWTLQKTTLFSGHYLHNRSTLDKVFWVISVYFNLRNTLPKSGTFLLGHPVYSRYSFLPSVEQRLQANLPISPAFTAIVSGHGKTKSYLHRFGFIDSQTCPCKGGDQTPEHLIHHCNILETQRD